MNVFAFAESPQGKRLLKERTYEGARQLIHRHAVTVFHRHTVATLPWFSYIAIDADRDDANFYVTFAPDSVVVIPESDQTIVGPVIIRKLGLTISWLKSASLEAMLSKVVERTAEFYPGDALMLLCAYASDEADRTLEYWRTATDDDLGADDGRMFAVAATHARFSHGAEVAYGPSRRLLWGIEGLKVVCDRMGAMDRRAKG